MIPSNNYLEKLTFDQLPNLAEFIVYENFSQHLDTGLEDYNRNEINEILKEEERFFENAQVYAEKDILGNINGAIRILKWNRRDVLPIKKIFNIDPHLWLENNPQIEIYHIGRFAIKKEIRDINLFKKLMVCAIAPVCERNHNIAFAEIDAKLLRVLNLLGIKTVTIGNSINYLGSETIPVSMSQEGLLGFFNKNKSLVSENILTHSVNIIKKSEQLTPQLF